MTEKQNKPREYDAVLGGKNPPPVNAAVLGGIEGVKLRLTAADELVRVGAVRDAMKYGEAGLDVAIASLDDESLQVRRAVLDLLEEKLSHPKVQALLVKQRDFERPTKLQAGLFVWARVITGYQWLQRFSKKSPVAVLGKEIALVNNKLIKIYREEFETVTVNVGGEIIKRKRRLAEMFVEDLGDGVELEMVSIPGGSFLMGSPLYEEGRYDAESPQHLVNVPPFFLGKYPVTQQQYEAVMGNNPSYFKGANRPVEQVTWNDATEFCERLSQRAGRQYRLPSEAEWEYACRAGTTTPFYFGPTITTDLANCNCEYIDHPAPKGIYREETTDVGSFPPNAFGLYDMHGNVSEWCQDVWHDNYNGAPTDGSAWESGGDSYDRMQRGGSWFDQHECCRCTFRNANDAGYWGYYWGFRVVLLPDL